MLTDLAVRATVKALSMPAMRSVNSALGKHLCKSAIGFSYAVLGRHRIKVAQRNSGSRPQSSTGMKYRTDGYALKTTTYAPEVISRIQASYLSKIDDPDFSKPKLLEVGVDASREIVRPIECIPELADLIDEEVRGALECYYDSYFRVAAVQAWRNYSLPPKALQDVEAYSNWWHLDARAIDHAKLFVNLSDVDGDCGPFHFIPAPRTRELTMMGFKRAKNGIPLGDDKNDEYILRAIGPAGAAVFCNTEHCLHKAGVPVGGRTRDIVQFRFLPSDRPLPVDWHKRPLQDA